MIIGIYQPFRGGFPVTGVTVLVADIYPLNMMGIGLHLPHDIHPLADSSGMALGAVARQAEAGMLRNRLVACMTAVAGLLVGMAVGKAVFMAAGADTGKVVAVAGIAGIVLAVRRVADIADAVEWRALADIVCPGHLVGKGYVCPCPGYPEFTIRCGRHLLMNHVDVRVTMRIVAVPAELAPLPGAGNLAVGIFYPATRVIESPVVLVAEVGGCRPGFLRFDKACAGVKADGVLRDCDSS